MKTITTSTKITFNATGEKYAISERTETGFQFKPIKFEKGLPTVPRTFAEIQEEFLSSQIDIEGFEHNENDSRLVELIMDYYIKDTQITEIKNTLSVANTKAIQNEKTISEQQNTIQQQKNAIQGYKDEIAKYSSDKQNWEKEKEEYKTTIEGLEAMAE